MAGEGAPRRYEDATAGVDDLREAGSFPTTRPEAGPGRTAVCKACLGGIHATRFTAFGPRAKRQELTLAADSHLPPAASQPPSALASFSGARPTTGRSGRWGAVPPTERSHCQVSATVSVTGRQRRPVARARETSAVWSVS